MLSQSNLIFYDKLIIQPFYRSGSLDEKRTLKMDIY